MIIERKEDKESSETDKKNKIMIKTYQQKRYSNLYADLSNQPPYKVYRQQLLGKLQG